MDQRQFDKEIYYENEMSDETLNIDFKRYFQILLILKASATLTQGTASLTTNKPF